MKKTMKIQKKIIESMFYLYGHQKHVVLHKPSKENQHTLHRNENTGEKPNTLNDENGYPGQWRSKVKHC